MDYDYLQIKMTYFMVFIKFYKSNNIYYVILNELNFGQDAP